MDAASLAKVRICLRLTILIKSIGGFIMTKIRITNDGGGVYEHGEIISVQDFIVDYCDCDNDKQTQEWLHRVSEEIAVKHIAAMWELEYEFCN